jgi:hypothetical protein
MGTNTRALSRPANTDHCRSSCRLSDAARAAAEENWSGPATETLMAEVERRIVDRLPARLVLGLGRDEARQTARVIAWERLRMWLQKPDTDIDRFGWGYLSNLVRWRVADALDKQTLRWARHLPTDEVPLATDHEKPTGDPADRDLDHALGPRLDALAVELVRLGMDRRAAVSAIYVACDDSDLRRSRIVARLREHTPIDDDAADALADLLVGNAQRRVAPMLVRLSREPRQAVVADPKVGTRLEQVAAAAPADQPERARGPELTA